MASAQLATAFDREHSPRLGSRAATWKLLRAYHEEGDLRARERLIELYVPLVRSLARRYERQGVHLEDLVQVGIIGLIKAIDRFELGRNVALASFATPTILGELSHHLRDSAWPVTVPRSVRERTLGLRRPVAELEARLGYSPTVAEIAREAGVDESDVEQALEGERARCPISLAELEEGGRWEGLAGCESDFEASEDRVTLASSLAALDAREGRIVRLCFFDDLSQSQIGEAVGLSQIQVSRVLRHALDKLRTELLPG
jgi:RNA polymerase sigma-B factor